MHREQGLTKCFDEYENVGNYILYSLQSPDLIPYCTPVGDFGLKSFSMSTTIIETQIERIYFRRIVFHQSRTV